MTVGMWWPFVVRERRAPYAGNAFRRAVREHVAHYHLERRHQRLGNGVIVAGDLAIPSLPPAPPPPTKPLLMVVDDDREVRRLTESLLRAHGCDVLLAPHGAPAIAELRSCCPALIVLDLNMPVTDGWQFRAERRYLTGQSATVPVPLLTAADDATTHAEALGAVGAIQKPFDPDDLMDAVSAALGKQPTTPDGIGVIRPWKRRVPPSKR
jgi:CheY-like chemotaxis protein